jgi:hypothetical protein
MSALTVFDRSADDEFARYRVELQVLDKIIGGVPKDPDTIRKWVESRIAQGADLALQQTVQETVEAMTAESGETPGFGEVLDEVSRQIEGGNGFKFVDGNLVYEGRCMKSALKEACNVAYPGTDWPGKPAGIRKGLMRYLAERVFIEDLHISLGVSAPSGTEQRIKHIMTPQGPRSAINVVDYVTKPKLTFTVAVLDDFLPVKAWARMWQCAEEIGIGADRARSDGKFELLAWDRL